jgi:hypothetical protein
MTKKRPAIPLLCHYTPPSVIIRLDRMIQGFSPAGKPYLGCPDKDKKGIIKVFQFFARYL